MSDEPGGTDESPHWLTADEQSAWRSLMRTAFQLSWALENQLQRASGLSLTEYYALAILSGEQDRTMRMSELAKPMQASLSRLSHLVTRLETRRLVRRETDPSDGRYTLAVLTDHGFDLLESAAPAHAAMVRRLVVDAVEPDHLTAVARAADTVRENVEAYRRESTG